MARLCLQRLTSKYHALTRARAHTHTHTHTAPAQRLAGLGLRPGLTGKLVVSFKENDEARRVIRQVVTDSY